jgi:uncharacterized damage-inducible protein DinB
MTFRDQLLVEFDLEVPFTREHIARVPDGKLDWKPHDKSMTLGWLAAFLGYLWTWCPAIAEQDSFDVVKAYEGQPPPEIPKTTQGLLEVFDKLSADARASLARADDSRMTEPWTLLANGNVLWSQPRWLVLRTFIMNHAVHHRAQLGVFLRLLGVPVPAVYNDSADEKGGMFMQQEKP